MKRTVVVLMLAATLVAAMAGCESGGTGATTAGTVPARATTTAPGSSATTSPPAQAQETTEVTLYFVRGEKLQAVKRAVPKVARIGAEAMKALVAGPTEEERGSGLSTALPAGTRFNGLTIEEEVARVDLSRAFESGGGLGLVLRVAQVTCTLDAFPSISGVRFALDGQLVDVLSGDGVVVDRPVTCAGYQEYLGNPGTTVPPASPALFAGIWPIASAAELANASPTWRDPAAVAKGFAVSYLGMTDPALFAFRSTGTGAGEVPVGFARGEGGVVIADPRPTTVLQLRQLGPTGPSGPWTVTGAASPDIEVATPAAGASIRSPVALAGRARAFEGTVQVEVREDGMVAGQSLGRGFVTGGGDQLRAFQGQVTFRSPTKPAGAVVFYERSQADGGTPVLRASVVRVALT